MDEGPIDPFNPYGRRYSRQGWPPRAADDTQEVPVVAAPRADDTQEVPVVAVSPVEPPPVAPGYAEASQPIPGPDAPPQWPTGVPEPTTATPVTDPGLTVPPELAPRRRSRRPLVLIGAGTTALLVLAGIAAFALLPGIDGEGDRADAKEPETTTPAESDEAGSASEKSASPSHNSKPEPDKSSSKPPPDDDDDDGDAPKPSLSVPTRPTKFGAWFAGDGTYQAKWGKPADDGGADIVSYVVGDCQGNNLAFTDSNTYAVSVTADKLTCMSVYAVNSQGLGQDAQHQIDNNP